MYHVQPEEESRRRGTSVSGVSKSIGTIWGCSREDKVTGPIVCLMQDLNLSARYPCVVLIVFNRMLLVEEDAFDEESKRMGSNLAFNAASSLVSSRSLSTVPVLYHTRLYSVWHCTLYSGGCKQMPRTWLGLKQAPRLDTLTSSFFPPTFSPPHCFLKHSSNPSTASPMQSSPNYAGFCETINC